MTYTDEQFYSNASAVFSDVTVLFHSHIVGAYISLDLLVSLEFFQAVTNLSLLLL